MLRSVRRWLNLGFDDTQWAIYSKTPEHRNALAAHNIELVGPSSAFSILLAIGLFIGHDIIFQQPINNAIPLCLAVLSFGMIALLNPASVPEEAKLRASWMLTALFSTTWYAVVIYFDTLVQAEELSVVTALAFMCLPALFDSNPRHTIGASTAALACFAVAEYAFVSHALLVIDLVNVLVGAIVGISLGQKRTASDISSLLYLDMYRTATKATLLVAQIDLKADTYEAMQVPDYVGIAAKDCETATEALELVGVKFVGQRFYRQYRELFDLDTLGERLAEQGRINLVYQNHRGMWCQLIVMEQARVDNEVRSAVVVVHDIDFVKRQELAYQEQLRDKALEAQRASAAKTNFLRRMSHDVRTPINGISGVLEMAESCPTDLKRQAELRQKAREALGYLLSLVNLGLNKLESGAVTLEHKPFDLIALFDETNSIIGTQAEERGLSFTVDTTLSDITHMHLIGSPVHLQQILLNLATNAVKYNRDGGSVTVSCRELGFAGGSAEYEFVCADTGIGMSEEFQKTAFDPFTQEDSRPRSSFYGAGLGLSIVYEMVRSMGGTISLESEQGKGSTFTVRLSFEVDPEPHEEAIEVAVGDALDGKHVLLVEDNELNREIAEFTLKGLGMEVTCAKNGREGLARFNESEPGEFDVVLMDVMMPVMDGLAATRQIRALDRPDATTVPIIAMTANAFHDDEMRSRDAGMNAHLSKPLDSGELARTICRLLPDD